MTEHDDGASLVELLAPFWTARRVLERLRISDQQLSVARREARILGVVTSDSDVFFPLFQFENAHDVVRVRPRLLPFLRILKDADPWTVGVLALTPAEELDGLTPVDWVREQRDPGSLVGYASLLKTELLRR